MNKCYPWLDLPFLTSVIGSIMITEASLHYSYLFTLWSIFNSFASCYYHYTQEICCKKTDVTISMISILYLFYIVDFYKVKISFMSYISLCIGFFFLGKSWGNCRPRKNGYYLNHSMFHILCAYSFRNILYSISSSLNYKFLF